MKLISFPGYEQLSAFAAKEISEALSKNPSLTLCMASGHTPALTCELLVKGLQRDGIDYSQLFFIGLDEWAGLSPENEGSCRYFFQKKIIEPLGLTSSQYHFFNALSNDLPGECKKMENIIADRGGIDIMLVGIGMNGHIGFNEPGTSFEAPCHVATLDEVTTTVGQKYFSAPMVLQKGITIGLGNLLKARTVYLLANGKKKAEVIRKTVEETATTAIPASCLQLHQHAVIAVDEEAASLLTQNQSN